MALVDKALKSKKEKVKLKSVEFKGESEYDELGLKVQNTSDYIVARILKLHPGLYTDDDRRILYQGNNGILQNQANLYRLSRYKKSIPSNFQQIVWLRLLDLVPVLDKNKIIIAPGLAWDKERGEITTDVDPRRKIQK